MVRVAILAAIILVSIASAWVIAQNVAEGDPVGTPRVECPAVDSSLRVGTTWSLEATMGTDRFRYAEGGPPLRAGDRITMELLPKVAVWHADGIARQAFPVAYQIGLEKRPFYIEYTGSDGRIAAIWVDVDGGVLRYNDAGAIPAFGLHVLQDWRLSDPVHLELGPGEFAKLELPGGFDFNGPDSTYMHITRDWIADSWEAEFRIYADRGTWGVPAHELDRCTAKAGVFEGAGLGSSGYRHSGWVVWKTSQGGPGWLNTTHAHLAFTDVVRGEGHALSMPNESLAGLPPRTHGWTPALERFDPPWSAAMAAAESDEETYEYLEKHPTARVTSFRIVDGNWSIIWGHPDGQGWRAEVFWQEGIDVPMSPVPSGLAAEGRPVRAYDPAHERFPVDLGALLDAYEAAQGAPHAMACDLWALGCRVDGSTRDEAPVMLAHPEGWSGSTYIDLELGLTNLPMAQPPGVEAR